MKNNKRSTSTGDAIYVINVSEPFRIVNKIRKKPKYRLIGIRIEVTLNIFNNTTVIHRALRNKI